MKKNVNTNISEMKNIIKRIPSTINEAINFDIDDTYDDSEAEEYNDATEKVEQEPVEKENPSNNASVPIDDIRKKALRAMAELADTPEDENYIMLKKVWQLVDRKPEQRTAPSSDIPQLQ